MRGTKMSAPTTTPSTPESELPRWRIDDIFASLDSREFTSAVESFRSEVHRLENAFDLDGIRAVPDGIEVTSDTETAGRLSRAITAYNNTVAHSQTLEAYVYALVSTNTRNEKAQALLSEIETLESRVTPLLARLADFANAHDLEALATLDSDVAEHMQPLQRLAQRSEHQMSEIEEGLFAELTTSGSSAWSRLQRDISSQLSAEVSLPAGHRRLPMPAIRGLANDSDPAVREAGFRAEQEAWPKIATACAAAMNAIKGEAITVNTRRRWNTPLDASLFANGISAPTFAAMQSAIVDSLPDFRRWMRLKARRHGHVDGLAWWDLIAPLPGIDSSISWNDSIQLIRDAFDGFSPSLSGMVDRAITERWLDAPPDEGKVGGAFCMPFVNDRSLLLLNWSGSMESTQTTAHELGHAYHNVQLVGRTPLQRRLPMALAETASIFCETLMVESGLKRLSGLERLALLNVDLQGATQVVVDIHSRFLFEAEVFARRKKRTLGVSELNDLMLESQLAAYGDGLDQTTAHPYMWILKPHYYGSHFYNWPYTYGLLFGLGLYATFSADPNAFRAGYDNFLSRSGMASGEELGQAFNIDVTSESFWVSSLDVLRARIDEFEQLCAVIDTPFAKNSSVMPDSGSR